MTFMNKIRRIIPTKKVAVNDLERQPAAKGMINPNITVHKATNERTESGSGESHSEDMINGEYKIIEREILPEKIICPDCGVHTLEGLDYCDNCGHEITV